MTAVKLGQTSKTYARFVYRSTASILLPSAVEERGPLVPNAPIDVGTRPQVPHRLANSNGGSVPDEANFLFGRHFFDPVGLCSGYQRFSKLTRRWIASQLSFYFIR